MRHVREKGRTFLSIPDATESIAVLYPGVAAPDPDPVMLFQEEVSPELSNEPPLECQASDLKWNVPVFGSIAVLSQCRAHPDRLRIAVF